MLKLIKFTILIAAAGCIVSSGLADPSVATLPPEGTNDTAVFRATVNPNGEETTAWFQWGFTSSLGQSSAPVDVGSGSSNVPLSLTLTGLKPGVAYYYRIIATNRFGIRLGHYSVFQAPRLILIGDGTVTNECMNTPVAGAYALASPIAIAAGQFHTIALKYDGTLAAWGDQAYDLSTPPSTATNVVAIAAGALFGTALRADGSVVQWGYDYQGDTEPPADATNIVSIACGAGVTLALREDGTIRAWGENIYGETDVPANATNIVAVAADGFNAMAMDIHGSIFEWGGGQGTYQQTNVPPTATNVSAIAVGGGLTAMGESGFGMALKKDGSVMAWGDNFYGQTNIPPSATNIIGIVASRGTLMAINAENSVIVWGNSEYGQTNVPPEVTDVVGGAMSELDSFALEADGTVRGWGGSFLNQLDTPVGLTNMAVTIDVSGLLATGTPGTYRVMYSVTNVSGAIGTASRTVVVLPDTEPPSLWCPTNYTVQFINNTQAVVSYSAEAVDNCSGTVPVVFTPPSGSIFALGTNTVLCSATDDSGNSNQCSFSVVVADTTPPEITCPQNMVLEFTSATGAIASFTGQAVDDISGVIPVTFAPPSGSTFPIGTSVVSTTAADYSGNSNQCSFSVTVLGPRGVENDVLLEMAYFEQSFLSDRIPKFDTAGLQLSQSLSAGLWVDETHVAPKAGEKVFAGGGKASSLLTQLGGKGLIPGNLAENWCSRIAASDRLLAAAEITSAETAGATSQQMKTASAALFAGDQALSQKKYQAAIQRYQIAWKKSAKLVGNLSN